MIQIPETANLHGFNGSPGGTHTSRTMMLAELKMLLAGCPGDQYYDAYANAILEDNVLLKQTMSTRKRSLRGLRELYALERETLLFRALHDLWFVETNAQPQLALLCALARDSILRATTEVILSAPIGDSVGANEMQQAVAAVFPGRYNKNILGKIGRNCASSWAQSGHLHGRRNKQRTTIEPYPVSVAYALLLGHLCGRRGEALFQTGWTQLLDRSIPELHILTQVASKQGYVDYRHTGGVTELSFSYLMRQA